MKKQLIAANWKMNGNLAWNQKWLENFLAKITPGQHGDFAIFAPSIYLPQISQVCQQNQMSYGSQDVSAFKNGAYTGDISAQMLTDFNCRYALIGHSERRHYFNESNDIIYRKFLRLTENQIKPVLCIGETKTDYESKKTTDVITHQLVLFSNHLSQSGTNPFDEFIIAYEPVWAIGTGLTPTLDEIQNIHSFIRQQFAEKISRNFANSLKILYGGSVKSNNASEILGLPDVDGALVGGASLNENEFWEIIKCSK